ncbi:hypothetical protein NE237_013795 [Protea cynaroides]|uniref:Cupin type-1 domain-containing protein n=1 Tax=Protea cynaroides TaxID=273540 RepID=A0A9Q0H3N9_9MAGN|nr:hypothetical protein NE237_013795 [Protea cynaroides]
MAFFLKSKFLLLLCFISLLSVNLILAFETEHPDELQMCKDRCRPQERFDERQEEQCERRCEDYYGEEQWRGREEEEEQHRENPYLFDEQSFKTVIREDEGSVRVLEKFTRRSELLRGLENFRVSFYEANPSTFTVPNHWDAESVSIVIRGRGTISLVRHDKRETYNIKQGDILRFPAGTVVYLVNTDKHEKLQIIDFVHAFSIPGHFKVPREKVERLFRQEKKGVFLRASEKQLKELSRHASSSEGGFKFWPFGRGGRSSGPFNLFEKQPFFSNDFGELYEAKPHEFKHLPELDVGVSFANISRGAMLGPYFNSRAVKVSVVVQGKGDFEMACPHHHPSTSDDPYDLERERVSGPHYQKVRGQLRPGVVVVEPAGHPFVMVASDDENLQIVCFEVNAEHNKKIQVAGKGNVIQQLEKEAKELSFGVPVREIDEVFNSQRKSFFFPGPGHRRHGGGRASA